RELLLVSEKTVNPRYYEGGTPSDDRGWSDGWDPDDMRCTCDPPLSDAQEATTPDVLGKPYGGELDAFNFGAAHPGGFNAAFGDGWVRCGSGAIRSHRRSARRRSRGSELIVWLIAAAGLILH